MFALLLLMLKLCNIGCDMIETNFVLSNTPVSNEFKGSIDCAVRCTKSDSCIAFVVSRESCEIVDACSTNVTTIDDATDAYYVRLQPPTCGSQSPTCNNVHALYGGPTGSVVNVIYQAHDDLTGTHRTFDTASLPQGAPPQEDSMLDLSYLSAVMLQDSLPDINATVAVDDAFLWEHATELSDKFLFVCQGSEVTVLYYDAYTPIGASGPVGWTMLRRQPIDVEFTYAAPYPVDAAEKMDNILYIIQENDVYIFDVADTPEAPIFFFQNFGTIEDVFAGGPVPFPVDTLSIGNDRMLMVTDGKLYEMIGGVWMALGRMPCEGTEDVVAPTEAPPAEASGGGA